MDASTTLQIFLILVILLVLVLVVVFRNSLFISNEDTYGEYETYFTGSCESETCGQFEGTKVIIQKCVPNEITGRGCLYPDGTMRYNSITTITPCSRQCVTYRWMLQSDSKCSLPTDECVNPGTVGSKTVTFICVAADDEGPNECTSSNLNPSNPFQQFFLGDTYNLTKSCTDFPNPVCNTSTCVFDPVLNTNPNCVTQSSPPFDILKEGVIYPSLGKVSMIGCSTELIDADDIVNRTVPPNYNPFICPNKCATPCRSFPFPGVVMLDDFDFLYGNLFLARIPGVGYVAPSKGLVTSSLNVIDNVPLEFYLFSQTREGCTQDEIEFSTAAIFTIGAREDNLYQLIVTVNTSYIGWLTSNGEWTQALNIYAGPGISSDQADSFQVELLDENRISIKTSSGDSINIPSTDGVDRSLDDLELVVFSPTTDFTDRFKCNLNPSLDHSSDFLDTT